MADVMSGGGHSNDESKFAALVARLRKVRLEAVQQREIAAFQRGKVMAARSKFAATTQSATSRAVAAHPVGEAATAIVAFAASAGGLGPLFVALEALPRDLQAGVIVLLHTGESSTLPTLLQMRCRLPVKFAENGEAILGGVVYVAPPQLHLIVNANRTFATTERGRLRFARPSADWLFDSIAASYSHSAIAVVLSGYQRDGARGVVRIRGAGGSTIAQHPETCVANDMPTAAIGTGSVSRILRPELIATAIIDWLQPLDLERMERDFENPFAATA